MNDLDALRVWLARFSDTKTTLENYRKKAERLLLWSIVQLGKPLSSLTHEDLLVYQHFLADPQPVALWSPGTGGNIREPTPAGALSTARSAPSARARRW